MTPTTDDRLSEINEIIMQQQLKLWQLLDTEVCLNQKLMAFEMKANGPNALPILNTISQHDIEIYRLIESKIKVQQQINVWKHNRESMLKIEEPDSMDYGTPADIQWHPELVQDHQIACDTPYTCDICAAEFATQPLIRIHMAVHSASHAQSPSIHPFSCKACGLRFSTNILLTDHQKRHRRFKCTECDRAFVRKHTLTAHMKQHRIGQIYGCDQCEKKYYTTTLLKRHQLSHTGIRYSCEWCEKTFCDPVALRCHVKTHSSGTSTSTGIYRCPECDKTYTIRNSLYDHMRRQHSGDERISCEICNATFNRKSSLRQHGKVHMGDKRAKFPCDVCKKVCSTKGNLKIHMRIHTGERPHVCEICGKSFIDPTYLRIHIRLHTGEKPYSCQYCERTFSDPRNHRKHMKIHVAKIGLS